MRCPHCGTYVKDGSLVCPACHAPVDQTTQLPRLQGSYCPSCGALVPSGADTCPKCGMWVAESSKAAPAALPVDDPAEESYERVRERRLEKQKTTSFARIESAIPAEQDIKNPYLHERPLRIRAAVVAALASLAIVGGAILLITHPWNPDAMSDRATEPADTSQAGFPGTIDKLTGQDTQRVPEEEVKTGDENTYDLLKNAYVKMGEYSNQVDESQTQLETSAYTLTPEELATGAQDAHVLAVEISNLISEVQGIDVTSGTYAQQKTDLLTLGSYLRNRIDAVSGVWQDLAEEGATSTESTLAPLRADATSFASLFAHGYSQFELEPPAEDATAK